MKKLLLSVLICLGVGGSACAMEQPLDLARVLKENQNEMIGALDSELMEQPLDGFAHILKENQNEIIGMLGSESFVSLSQVCKFFYKICKDFPIKCLNITFSDAVEHKNKKVFMHLIAQPDWIVQSNVDEEVFIEPNDDAHKIVKIFKRPFKSGVQPFLGDCALYYMSQANKIVRCFSVWHDFEMYKKNKPKGVHALWFNVDSCDEIVNKAFEEYLKKVSYHLYVIILGIDDSDNRSLTRQITHGCHVHALKVSDMTWVELKFEGLLDPVDDFIKEFGMFTLLGLTKEKDNKTALQLLLKYSKIQDYWISCFSKKAD